MFKRCLSIFLAGVLAFSSAISPYCAYAEAVYTESLGFSDVLTEVDPSVNGEGSTGEASGAFALDESAAAEGQDIESDESAENLISSESADGGSSAVLPEDIIDYIYIDQSVLALGDVQYIAVAFKKPINQCILPELELSDSSGGVHKVAASAVNDGAALFEVAYNDQSCTLSYEVTGVSCVPSGSSEGIYIDFSSVSEADQTYCFDVVNPETARALSESNEGGISAIVVNENGSLESADSLEDALAVADSEGVKESQEEATAPVSSDPRARAAIKATRENYLVVAIDPGHGGSDSGAVAHGLKEKDLNWSIANHFKNELLTYTGVTPFLTTSGDNVGLQERVNRAARVGADVIVSVHINSSTASSANGCEVWVPNNSSYYGGTHDVGQALGMKIENELSSLGLNRRGVFTKNYPSGESASKYPDGSAADYYSIIRNARKRGIPAIIVEHAFISNSDDASKLSQDAFRKRLGIADATGVAEQYNLGKDAPARAASSVAVKSHIAELGWEGTVYDKKVSGSTGKGLDLQAFQISPMNAVAKDGGISYRADVAGTWQDWKSNGQTAGTTGQGKAVQGIQVKLTGAAASKFDIYYRVHVANIGWLGWAKNGASAGSSGFGYGAQAIEVVIVDKGAAAPGSTAEPYRVKQTGGGAIAKPPTLTYRAHVQNVGWQSWTSETAGTTGRALHLEALQFKLDGHGLAGKIESRAHVENIGWQNWQTSSDTIGTTGRNLQVETIQLRLSGPIASKYDIYYRVHSANVGWLGWAKNGGKAGTAGYGYSIESVQIRLVPKGSAAPGKTYDSFRAPMVKYQSHVQNIGWQGYVADGAIGGTTGRNLNLEALNVQLGAGVESGGIQAQAHVRNIGWQKYTSGTSGTTGKNLAIEAVRIKLTGAAANLYDVYYRVHSAEFGWLGWAKNDSAAGSEGFARSVQAIQIKIVPKGSAAPGSTSTPFRSKYDEPIMGRSKATASSMARAFRNSGSSYPDVYASKGAAKIDDFCRIVVEEANAEGVRAEIVFAQAMHETGWLKFGGSVKLAQCNFAGLGATGGDAGGASFKDVRTGIRAQVQHLKAYASTAKLNRACVDPRFNYVKRGSAALLFDLNGKWAVPGTTYGQSILRIVNTVV